MAKYNLKIQARLLRKDGESVKVIAEKLSVSKSTVSLWVRDIVLTVKQLEALQKRKIEGSERGRIKGALIQKERRLKTIEKYRILGKRKFATVSEAEFFAAGVALYWAEGSKKDNTLSFCNSDPFLVVFMLKWLEYFFNVDNNRFILKVGINESHREREEVVKQYWSETTGIPLSQFRKTSFKKVESKKVYANNNAHYGTLTVRILKGTELCYKILGLIQGLSRQGSSVG